MGIEVMVSVVGLEAWARSVRSGSACERREHLDEPRVGLVGVRRVDGALRLGLLHVQGRVGGRRGMSTCIEAQKKHPQGMDGWGGGSTWTYSRRVSSCGIVASDPSHERPSTSQNLDAYHHLWKKRSFMWSSHRADETAESRLPTTPPSEWRGTGRPRKRQICVGWGQTRREGECGGRAASSPRMQSEEPAAALSPQIMR